MKNFLDEFALQNNKTSKEVYKSDYDAFENKELLDELRNKIIQNLIDHNVLHHGTMDEFIHEQINQTLEGYDLSNIERSYIYNLIDNEINGYGPITDLLEDKNITEIMVNGKDEIYIEVDGHVIKDDTVSFINEDHIVRTIQRMIQPLGRTIDTANPMVDARLKDGSRLNAVLPPLSLKGPVLTIRKFKDELATIDDFLRTGTLTPYMARFLEACIQAKLNIIICGGTGSGKTTLLNVLSSFIHEDERIITIEDAAELRLKQKHVISLETRLVNYEGTGEVTIRDLVINSLRMRPDRIIVGEVRGKEAFDMLQAMNTGHTGSLTTMHANSIREYIENAIHLVVNVERLSDGKRKVTSICEVVGFEKDMIQLKEIFSFRQTGLTKNGEVMGEFILHDYVPKVYEHIKAHGIDTLKDIFG